MSDFINPQFVADMVDSEWDEYLTHSVVEIEREAVKQCLLGVRLNLLHMLQAANITEGDPVLLARIKKDIRRLRRLVGDEAQA